MTTMNDTYKIQTVTDLLNNDYKEYALYVVEDRAIPAFADGLKPSQRKALAAGMRYAKDRPLKVSALGGYCIAEMAYHHGDASINGAITVMNQEFMQGMPYFDKIGQYGWLYDKKAGAPRYIWTKLSGWSKLVLADEQELTYCIDEDTGKQIEPRFYLPIIPMLLVNGTNGIAVGYSTNFINRNPLEVTLAVREYLATGKLNDYQFTPFVNGHTGLWSWWNGQFEHVAPYYRKNKTCLIINGLPISWSLEKYRGFLSSLQEQGFIQRWHDISTKGKCMFEVHMREDALNDLIDNNGVLGTFQLVYRLPQDNLTCIMPDRSVKRFENAAQFIREFVDFRLKYYVRRKQRRVNEIKSRILYLQSLVRFVQMVLDGQFTIKGKDKRTLEAELKAMEFDIRMLNENLYSFTDDTIRKHVAEITKLQKELEYIEHRTETQMYIDDIDNLLVHIRKFYRIEPVINLKHEYLLRIEEPVQ